MKCDYLGVVTSGRVDPCVAKVLGFGNQTSPWISGMGSDNGDPWKTSAPVRALGDPGTFHLWLIFVSS